MRRNVVLLCRSTTRPLRVGHRRPPRECRSRRIREHSCGAWRCGWLASRRIKSTWPGLGHQARRSLSTMTATSWPALRVEDWTATRETLHRWTQIVGKVRLAQAPMVNHWWQVTFYVTARGLTTSPIPYGSETFQIDFDFVDH